MFRIPLVEQNCLRVYPGNEGSLLKSEPSMQSVSRSSSETQNVTFLEISRFSTELQSHSDAGVRSGNLENAKKAPSVLVNTSSFLN